MQTAACAAVFYESRYYAKKKALYSVNMRIAVFNQKGGVGKTTCVLNLAAATMLHGRSAMVIDLDPQAHLTAIHRNALGKLEHSIFAFYQNRIDLPSLEIDWPGIGTLIPAHSELIKVDSIFGKGPNILNRLNQGLSIETYKNRSVFIDCCPFLGVLSLNAIFAANHVLVPVSSDYMSLRGARQIDHTLTALEPIFKHRISRSYLLTRFDRRRSMCFAIKKQMVELFGDEVCETVISENVALAESPALSRDIYSHAPDSRGAEDYLALLGELQAKGFL
jgi:chromosome partitioning protein